MPLDSYNIFVHKKYHRGETDPRPHTKQAQETGGPKCILNSTGVKRSSKTRLVSKIPVYAFHLLNPEHIIIRLRLPE